MSRTIIPDDKSASSTSDPTHLSLMRLALIEAKKCIPTPTAFCVGCIITSPSPSGGEPKVLSTGYSRELPGNTHAEQCALSKLPTSPSTPPLSGLDLYTTMEPCSTRLSGNLPCVDRILALPKGTVKRVFMGVKEPKDFVECEGVRKLREAGVGVWSVEGVEGECLEVARRGHEEEEGK